jgi:FkbM family methyltransferase
MIAHSRKLAARYLRGFARRIEPSVDSVSRPVSPSILPAGHACTDPFFDCLVRLGYNPQHIVDVGANRGGWTRTALRYFPNACYSLFEPQQELLQDTDLVKNSKVRIHFCGAGPVTSTMKLSKHQRDDSFSFALTPEQAQDRGREQIDAPVVALDEFLPQLGLPSVDILKIDAEGWDLEVLKGAEKTVAHAGVVLLEAAVMNKSFGNTMERVIREMSARNFVVFDITDLNRTQKDNALWLVEIAFVPQGGVLHQAVSTF